MPSGAEKRKKAKQKGAVSAALSAPNKSTTEEKAAPVDPRAWTSIDPPLSPWLLDAVSSMGFSKMTPVQASTIPLFLGNKDVVVEAVTGSGKTLAFLVPVIERILRALDDAKKNHVTAIIVSPTRELAGQIHSVLLSLLEFHAPSLAAIRPKTEEINEESETVQVQPSPLPSGRCVKPLLLLGGNTSPAQDLMHFLDQSPNLLIGTPGRLNELLSSKHVYSSADSFEALVLDEADRLLDLGFKETLSKIIARLPKQRRTGLFSASITDAVVGSLIRTGIRNPVKVVVKVRSANTEQRTPVSLSMSYVLATPSQRLVYLQRILSPTAVSLFPCEQLPQKTIVYFSNCASVDYYTPLFSAILQAPGDKTSRYSIVPLHGKLSAGVRARNFDKFVAAVSPTILLTTDLAARGLDIPEVDLVLQIDAPTDPKVFLHRCGRAGRAGRRGLAVLFLSPGREEGYLDFLEVRKTPVTQLGLPPSLSVPPTGDEVAVVVRRMREKVMSDRALYEKGLKAFVSHVRAHSKHQTTSIFRVADLDWSDLAQAFAQLKMPRMPELKKAGIDPASVDLGFGAHKIDIDKLKFADKVKEAQRIKALKEAPVIDHAKIKKEKEKRARRNAAWSDKTEGLETKQERRNKKRKRRDVERTAKMTEEERRAQEEVRELVETVKKRKLLQNRDEEEFNGFDGLD